MTVTRSQPRLKAGERQSAGTPACPNCGGSELSAFYSVANIPVHSCLLMPTRQAALTFPRGDLQLGFCRACGFIANMLYDASFRGYSMSYEETQGFSPRFNSFQAALVRRLVDTYGVRRRRVLEIGCGKGEFLTQLCDAGDNRGVGIDPSYVPQRTPPEAARRVEFIQDYFSSAYEHLQADVVICRHTLEHIAPTQEFLQSVRRMIGSRTETLVFFEVPDVLRVLREGAFWDIYYEHCSYFTQGSLGRLFHSCGFEVMDSCLDFDAQYVLLIARPQRAVDPALASPADDLAATAEAVSRFPQVVAQQIEEWRSRVAECVRRNQRVVAWGSGSKGVAFLTTVRLGDEVPYVVDINPYRQGKYMPGTGQEIVAPEALADYRPDCVIVMNPVYRQEIAATLERLGVRAQLVSC